MQVALNLHYAIRNAFFSEAQNIFDKPSVFAAIVPGNALLRGKQQMYGLIGKMTTVEGKREALIAILLEGVA